MEESEFQDRQLKYKLTLHHLRHGEPGVERFSIVVWNYKVGLRDGTKKGFEWLTKRQDQT